MSSPTADAVYRAFKRAVLEHLQKSLRTGEDWDRYNAIKRETDARLMTEQSAYKRDFTVRVAEAKQIILREENGLRLEEPLPSWAEKHSSSDALNKKAEERVGVDHGRRISAIKTDELHAFQDLAAEIRNRDAPTPMHESFQERSQDRSGPSRS